MNNSGRLDRALPPLLGAATSVSVAQVLTTVIFYLIIKTQVGPKEFMQTYQEVVSSMTWFLLGTAAGALAATSGGYIAARIAGRQPYLNALFAALIYVGWGLMLNGLAVESLKYDVVMYILAFAIPVPCALLGAYFFKRT